MRTRASRDESGCDFTATCSDKGGSRESVVCGDNEQRNATATAAHKSESTCSELLMDVSCTGTGFHFNLDFSSHSWSRNNIAPNEARFST